MVLPPIGSGRQRKTVHELMKEKDEIEKTIAEEWEILKKNDVGMKDPLVTHDGFPRSDIDVYQVRHARHRIICFQNDHTSLLHQIEKEIHDIHAKAAEGITENPYKADFKIVAKECFPFAKIDRVDVGSPAHIDGLKVGDLICKFGDVTIENFRNLLDVGKVVQRAKNKMVEVIVQRNLSVKVFLTPREWDGKGLLGCNIITYDVPER